MKIPVFAGAKAAGAKVTLEPLCPAHENLKLHVCINPRFAGRPYRYTYVNCVGKSRLSPVINATCRVDVTTGAVVTFYEKGAIPAGEPKFVPRPGPDADEGDELDGVVLLDYLQADGRSLLLVLDGATFAEVARLVTPFRQFWSVSSTWVGPDSSLGATSTP